MGKKKKVLIIVVLFKLVRVQVYTYMFQKFIVKLPSTREVILLNSFYKRDTFFVTSTRELYCLIPSTGGIHLFITSTKEVILLGSFYKRRYYSWSFGRRYIAWFLLQEEVLFLVFREKIYCLVPSTGGATAISYFYWRGLYCLLTSTRRSSQLPADLSEAERCLGLVILSAGSLSCPLFLV